MKKIITVFFTLALTISFYTNCDNGTSADDPGSDTSTNIPGDTNNGSSSSQECSASSSINGISYKIECVNSNCTCTVDGLQVSQCIGTSCTMNVIDNEIVDSGCCDF